MSTYSKISEFILRHRHYFVAGLSVADTVAEVVKDKNPIRALKGAFSLVDELVIKENDWLSDLFNESNGWRTVGNQTFSAFFPTVLKKYPYTSISSKGGNDQARIFTIDGLGDLAVIDDSHYDDPVELHYRGDKSIEEVLEFIIGKYIDIIDSDLLSIMLNNNPRQYRSGIMLVGEPQQYIKGSADPYVDDINLFLKKGYSRSIMFYGPPGCGKTTLVNSICKDLGMRTLQMRSEAAKIDLNFVRSVIKIGKIQAVIIDDFDQIDNSNEMLELLGLLNQNVKLLFGVANSLQKFHPAILRPARFDDVVLVNKLEEKVVRDLMGDKLYKLYGESCKEWPIAYINELLKKHDVYDGKKAKMSKVIEELDRRVKAQIEDLQ